VKVIGDREIFFYPAKDESPHSPGKEELWQESWVLYMWDTKNKVYSFFRLSQVPNRNGGETVVWLNIWTPDYMYKHTDDEIPLITRDITDNALVSGEGLCRYEYNGDHLWQINDQDVKVNLVMKDDHPGLGSIQKGSGVLISEVAGNHAESTGRVTGTITVRDKEYIIDGVGWRDHSWGKRDWLSIRAHRGIIALFDEFNFFGTSLVGTDGKLSKNGMIIRESTVQFTDRFEVIVHMAEDGISNCGGRVNIILDGDTYALKFEPIGKAAISLTHSFACTDTLCTVKMMNKVGYGMMETSSRPQGGDATPFVFPSSPGVIQNGLYEIS